MLRTAAIAIAIAALVPGGAQGQADSATTPPATPAPAAHRPLVRSLRLVASPADARLRDAALRAADGVASPLLRSTSTLTPRLPGAAYLVVLAPQTEWTWNSEIPYSVNDGRLFSGRGASGRILFGVEAVAGPLRLVLAPELDSEQNRDFTEFLPAAWDSAQRARYTLPWVVGPHSADLPYRPGDGESRQIHAGESSLTLGVGPVEVGAATESQWWGPGIRNAILLSNQAGGFPHLLARTTRPLRTPLGRLEARWVAGRLSSSEFDTTSAGGSRYLSGAGVVLHPDPSLELGAARIVYGSSDEIGAGDAVAALTRWAGAGDTLRAHPFEQMTTLFARLRVPSEGAELYAEWGRRRLPSPRSFLEQPEHTQGYTLGGQWSRPGGPGAVRLQAELTYLEKSSTYRTGSLASWYAGRAVPQGYTHRGQVLGASVGPGGSGQSLGADYLWRRAQLGAFLTRTRWANDAYYTTPGAPLQRYRAHDVSILGGLRGGLQTRAVAVDASWSFGRRYNFLFQSEAISWETRHLTVSPFNHTLRLNLSFAPRH